MLEVLPAQGAHAYQGPFSLAASKGKEKHQIIKKERVQSIDVSLCLSQQKGRPSKVLNPFQVLIMLKVG